MPDLIYVPIVHTEADLGSLAKSFKNEFRSRYSQQTYENHVRTIEQMWVEISNSLLKMKFRWSNVRLYQDGLPVCGREMQIVEELAEHGSLNHRLLLSLIKKGAHLEGTEDRELLLKEYQFYQSILKAGSDADKKRLLSAYQQESAALLQQRDQFVARRIAETLADEETGILFMGMLHQVEQYLDDRIRVQFLIRRLPLHKNVRLGISN